MNRNDLQQIARIRLKEAKKLLDNGLYDGAYYLSGYAVECGLKACIAKNTRRYDFPDKRTVFDSYTHSLEQLIGVASLRPDLKTEIRTNRDFASNWALVKDWNESSRYEKHDSKKARAIYYAIVSRRNGVLKWIRKYW